MLRIADALSRYRPLLVRLHFYAGILVGPFLLLTALTGFLYALAPQLENALYRDTMFVESSGTTVPISQQVSAARERQPEGSLVAVRPAAGPGDTTRLLFDVPGLGESERLAVFVNPGNATATGELVAYGSSGALPFRTWLSQLHRSLHLGEPGRIYSELAASWLWLVALAGLGLFLPLLGISLAAFVVIDRLIGFYRWRKAGAPAQDEAPVEPAEESDELLV